MIFDLDGVLVDSEQQWDRVRRRVVADNGGRWTDEATTAMLGMSTPEWANYLVADLGVALTPDQAASTVIEEMARGYAAGPPVLPGAVAAVRAVAADHPVAIASSSPPVLISAFLSATGLEEVVRTAVSSEQAGAGKPAPDVYLLAARRLGVAAEACAAVEDSTNGLRAALAAGMTVFAVPNPHFPPDPEVLAQATAVLNSVADLPAALAGQA
ncbi:haloacid dehalogenase superfamily, subfamily IA, variant 3 with third motif having DD or ED [Goodfellowiella coeruleoviolacea]|uniref:Haloacid dehalogenase superfamily, subfamily IA, variant 3 with third motif having DD or ED n=1 Tax=Goodfellowiella coeruleoviolacea TaxID=334858 RepID=A0AAE3GK38_9PSEU|nr:haloacid dehalogenase superfamily, subfamily IA, variant 3 with third motif having DD or ED [Goodfellowiella coeruleoviolacea]